MDKEQTKTKHVNIRITPDMLNIIDDIHVQMESELQVFLSRSQVMQRLIQLGIETYQNAEV